MKVTIKGYIHAIEGWNGKRDYSFLHSADMSQYGYINIMAHELVIDLPDDLDLTSTKLAALEKQKAKLREDFNRRIAEVNEQISKLQALEYVPAEVL